MTTHQLTIEGMTCGHCVRAVKQALEAVEGARKVEVQIGHATIETDDAVPRARLVAAVEAEDYRVTG